ncbi:MAG: Omp28 family outer membrane lipoprotein [Candidatus Kapabacteria bacterium]|nr:Omp28 family outer membrane lipoprotein [Candidatus Kapabacteria bacterium]
MKTLKYIIPSLILISMLFYSCDIIEPPYEENFTPVEIDSTKKKVLIEDITGFRCGNCPEAAALAHEIVELYPNNVIVIAVHAGALAVPTPSRKYNFLTQAGQDIANRFNLPATPYGLINRKAVGGQFLLSPKAWATAATAQIQLDAVYKLELAAEFEGSSKTINLEANVKALAMGANNHFIAAYIIEDSVIQYQQDDRLYPNIHVEDFVHMHVLRSAMNGSWGTELSDEPLLLNQSIKKNLSFTIPEEKDWVPKNLSLVVMIRDNDTEEILQVEKVKLIK